jgi:hypothetical protein
MKVLSLLPQSGLADAEGSRRRIAVEIHGRCPLYPRTSLDLFDHLIGATLYRLRHGDADRLSGLEVDD